MNVPARPGNRLVDLPRLLEERHGLSRARAAELTKEAVQHLIATDCDPEDEFGPVEVYALRLAEEEPAPRTPWWTRNDVQATALAVILVGYLVSNLVARGPAWQTALAAVGLATELVLVAAHLPRERPGKPTSR